jgi:Carboxypeptidase regulatory-like domain
MTTLWVVLLYVALFAAGGSPEIAIRGRIVNPAGAAIAGASVRVLDEGSRNIIDSAVSDADGKFSIGSLDAGDYLLAVSAAGYQESLIPVVPAQNGVSVFPALRLSVLDCDAPGMNCDTPATGVETDPHPVIVTRDVTMNANEAVDLQKGELVPRDSAAADIRLDSAAGGLYVVPLNGTAFTTTSAEGSCGKTRDEDPLRIDGLGPASEIVVVTSRKQCSRLFITSEIPPGADQASFHFVTRSR